MRPQPDFIHEFISGSSNRTLLLLHGTGGNERDLIPLGRELDPTAALLSPRGKVLENGMPRFFRRLAEGVFDLEDLKNRTNELADFVAAAAQHYGFAADKVVAVGYSNGAARRLDCHSAHHSHDVMGQFGWVSVFRTIVSAALGTPVGSGKSSSSA